MGNLKFKYRNQEFWRREYYADTAWKNAVKIKEYIKNQLKENELREHLTIPTHLWVASNNFFSSIRPYQPHSEAANSTGLRRPSRRNTPRLSWGILIMLNRLIIINFYCLLYLSTKH